MGSKLENGVKEIAAKYSIPVVINRVGGMFTIFFTENKEVRTYDDVKTCNVDMFNRYFETMINSGINIAPSQFEAVFLSVKHEEEHINKFLEAFEKFAVNETK